MGNGDSTMTEVVMAECGSCQSTGLYHGMMELDGEYVVCVTCGGAGGIKTRVKPFNGRKKVTGVEKVRVGSGLIIDSPTLASWFSYEDFLRRF